MMVRLTRIARSRPRAPSVAPSSSAPHDVPPLFRSVRRNACLLPLAVLASLWVVPAAAQGIQRSPSATPGGGGHQAQQQNQPAVFTADEVTYDDTLAIVLARGNVEISQGDRIVRADVVTYNRRTEVVTASGNVVLVEPSGDVLFANYAELQDDLKNGFVQNISIMFTDNSRMIGTSGIREGELTVVDRAVYSPCNLCAENPREAPLWQLRAVEATHDRESHDVIYHDAFLDMFGFPVLYAPYLSHPDPTVKRRQGFLVPTFGSTGELGAFAHGRYYFDIAPDQDATADLVATRNSGFVLGGEYRRRFVDGAAILRGTVNRSDRQEIDNGVTVTRRNAFRWSVDSNALFDIDENWRAGAVVRRVSDNTYLKSFNFNRTDVLRSNAFVEGFYGLSYATVEAFSFQDLRTIQSSQPDVVPWGGYSYVSEPGSVLGGQLLANASFLQLLRNQATNLYSPDIQGVNTRRLSLDTGWQRGFYSDTGLVTNLSGTVSGDLYWSDNVPVTTSASTSTSTTQTRDGVTASRFVPRITITTSYPLVRQGETSQQLIEPILSFSAAPRTNTTDIPNNDSRDVEFDEINLWRDNRFPGRDRIDGGIRFTYGLRAGIYGYGGGSGTLFLGESYRLSELTTAPPGSGLDTKRSDVVGRLTIAPSPWLNVDWRFRLNEADLTPRRQEVVASGGIPALRLYGVYTFLDTETSNPLNPNKEEVSGVVSSNFANHWTGFTTFRYDLTASEARSVGGGVYYGDECFTFSTSITRNLTTDQSATGGLTVLVTLAFRNLGTFPFSLDIGNLFGGGTTTR